MIRTLITACLIAAQPMLVGACTEASHAAAGPKAHAALPDKADITDLPREADIARLFDVWAMTLGTGDAREMAALYADDAVLLPTVSNKARTTPEAIQDYFTHFQAMRPRGTINERHIAVLGRTMAVDSGIYTFDIVRDGRADYVVARYSFVYEKRDGQWLIISHHSSAMPQPVDERPPALSDVKTDAKIEAPMPTEKHAPERPDAAKHGSHH